MSLRQQTFIFLESSDFFQRGIFHYFTVRSTPLNATGIIIWVEIKAFFSIIPQAKIWTQESGFQTREESGIVDFIIRRTKLKIDETQC